MTLKRYVLLTEYYLILDSTNPKELRVVHYDDGDVLKVVVDNWYYPLDKLDYKTSDNILDLVEPCKLWDLNGDLYEYAIDDFVFIEKVYDDTDFSTREVKAIYKRQTNGDYKRYEVEA